MAVCDGCGKPLDDRAYQISIPLQPGRFDSVECAVKTYRRRLAQQHLAAIYGMPQSEPAERAQSGSTMPV